MRRENMADQLKGLDKAVRKALTDKQVPEGKTCEIEKIFVKNVSNNPIHEYIVELGPPR
jgi:hypothetical protein